MGNEMDYRMFFTILGTIIGIFAITIRLFMMLSSKMDKLETKMDKMNDKIDKNREDVLWLKFRMDPHEHPEWKKELEKNKTREKAK